jgi:hypothetical protein
MEDGTRRASLSIRPENYFTQMKRTNIGARDFRFGMPIEVDVASAKQMPPIGFR